MSVDILIKQKKLFKSVPDLKFVETMCRTLGLSYGVSNTAYAFSNYYGGNTIGNTIFVLYKPQKIGRGFRFWLDKNRHDCNLRLNTPSTEADIADFYDCAGYLCKELKTNSFLQDSEKTIQDSRIDECKTNITAWNAGQLSNHIKQQNPIVFGAIYPITMEQEIVEKLSGLQEPDAMNLFALYLHEKQIDDYYYYAKASLYKNNEKGITQGVYAVTQGCSTIFPLHPYIPFNYGVDLNYPVDEWIVTLVKKENGEYKAAGSLTFEDFASKYKLSDRKHFDANHVIIELSGEEIAALV